MFHPSRGFEAVILLHRDKDSTDREHGTFYQMLPTARKYAFFPLYNLMNNEDLFIQAIFKPKEAFTIRTDLHSLSLQNKHDLGTWAPGRRRAREAYSIRWTSSNKP